MTTGRPPLFGTDGIRGAAGAYPLDRVTVSLLGLRLAEQLQTDSASPTVVLGGDTRQSTAEICAWLAGGLAAGGAVCRYAGTVPTPGVAHLVAELGADAGVVVSASHNPHSDNGIKLFDRRGGKWTRTAEETLGGRLAATLDSAPPAAADLDPEPSLAERYLSFLAGQLPGPAPLAGLRLVVDTANGAASALAEELFRRLGARPEVIFDRPTGRNINQECGSTHPQAMAARTVERGAALGVALDGDADRLIWADETGRVRDGDSLLYLWATELDRTGALAPRRVVATSMSNLGLEKAFAERGIELVRCGVGDRQVADTMRREGIVLGGEQSGHIIHRALSPAGDGLQTAIHLAAIAQRAGRPLGELAQGLRRYPQVLLNVPVRSRPPLESVPRVVAAARRTEERLGDQGRLVLRYSGTEPLARVMIEGRERDLVEGLASDLATVLREELGDG